jgi:hypothetical protein
VSEFLAESSHEVPWLVKDLLASGAITMWAAPYGVGKTLVSIKLARELAIGGMFRQQTLAPTWVLYLNRDNPKDVIAAWLRGWEVPDVPNFRLMTREKVPELKDRDGWARFPVEYFDVVVIDSVGSSPEGITEKEGRDTTKILATLLDLAARGVAILLLNNTTKDGSNVRGRGEWIDRVDILYEVRDATGFTPSGKKPWWQELPPAGGKDWAERAGRRAHRTHVGLAFVCSKARLGPEPEPFCLEVLVLDGKPWSPRDVTHELCDAGQRAASEAEFQLNVMILSALDALTEAVREQQVQGLPMSKTEAVAFLCGRGLTHMLARKHIDRWAGKRWTLEPIREGARKQSAYVLQPRPTAVEQVS